MSPPPDEPARGTQGSSGVPLGPASLLALGVNGVVGVGIFFTPNLVAALVPGRAGASVYLVTALLLLPIAWSMARLGRGLPVDGGPSVWAHAAFGEVAGLAVGWMAAVSAVVSTAAVLAGIGAHLGAALGWTGAGPSAMVSLVCMAVLGSVVATGLRPSAWTWNTLTVLKLTPLVLLVALFALAPADAAPGAVRGVPDYGRALLVALFPLQGFEVLPVLAGSARGRSALPIAMFGTLAVAALLYAALHLACVAALPDLASREAPIVAAAEVLGGAGVARLVAFGTNVSALGIAFGMLVMTPRYLAVLGSEAGLGSWLGRTDARGVPRHALILTIVSVVALMVSARAVEALVVLSSAAVLVQYVTAQAAVVRLGMARKHGFTPAAGIPAALGLGAVFLLGWSLEPREITTLAGALAAGAVVWIARRLRTKVRTSA